MAVTIKDVAKQANVSSATVSAVINNNSKYVRVGKETKKRIKEAMREMNYVPNMYARTMKKGQTFTIGIILADGLSVPTAMLIKGIKSGAVGKGYHIILGPSSEEHHQELFYLENFQSRRVDGIIIVPAMSGETLPKLKELNDIGLPIVVCERPWVTDIYCVFSNFEGGTYEATNYLIKLGHSKIAFCIGNEKNPQTTGSALIRYHGYRKALEAKGIEIRKDFYLTTEGVRSSDGHELAKRIIAMSDKPTAIVARNDEIAAGALKTFLDNGVKVPQDISIIGFGNKEITETLQVPLTTIETPKLDVGKKAAEILIEKINKSKEPGTTERHPAVSVGFMPKLIIRDSCAPPK